MSHGGEDGHDGPLDCSNRPRRATPMTTQEFSVAEIDQGFRSTKTKDADCVEPLVDFEQVAGRGLTSAT